MRALLDFLLDCSFSSLRSALVLKQSRISWIATSPPRLRLAAPRNDDSKSYTIGLFFLFSSFILASSSEPTGKLPSNITPIEYNIHLVTSPKKSLYSGEVKIQIYASKPTQEFWIHAGNFDVHKAEIKVGDHMITATYTANSPSGAALIHSETLIPTGSFELTIRYTAPYNQDLYGLYQVKQNKQNYLYTQFEPIAARTCFPSFDEPRFKTPFQISLTVPKGDIAISNAKVQKKVKHANQTTTWVFEKTAPMPTYLIAFAIGPFDVVQTPRMGKVPLRGITPKGLGKQIAYALQETPKILKILEDYFGIPYPYTKLDLIAVPDFASGAMENPGAITFRDSLLLFNSKTAPISQIRRFAEVTAHELAHQWFGNLVTMYWWEDIWLNEAFATWMASKVMAQYKPEYHIGWDDIVDTQQAMNADSLSSARRIQEPIVSNHDIYNAFDAITYTKGAAVISMFENYLSPAVFQTGVRNYLKRFSNENADTQDFISELSKASGSNIAPSFGSFLTQPGVPLLVFKQDRYEQKRYLPFGSLLSAEQSWQIPFCPTLATCQLLTRSNGTLSQFGFPAKNGLGYYRFSQLSVEPKTLQESEKIAWAYNLLANFHAGNLNTSELLPLLTQFVTEPNRYLALAPISILTWLDTYVIPENLKTSFRDYVQKIYNQVPRFSSLDERKLFEVGLEDFQANVAMNSKIRSDLAQKGLRFFKSPQSIDRNELGLALSVLVEEKPGFLTRLVRKLETCQDAIERAAILKAVAQSDLSLELVLSPILRRNEVLTLLMNYMSEPQHWAAGLLWVDAHLQDILKRLSEKHSGRLPWVMSSLCSESDAETVERLFTPVIKNMAGGPRELQGVLERIRLCFALVQQQRPNALKFFEAQHGSPSTQASDSP